jgi:hypothetical protein
MTWWQVAWLGDDAREEGPVALMVSFRARPGARSSVRARGPRGGLPGGCIYAGAAMADLVDRVRKELDARIEQLRPLVREFERLERAAAALARAGARAVPGLGASRPAPAVAKLGAKPAGRSTRAKPAGRKPPAQRRAAASGRSPAPAAAKPQSRSAGRSTRAKPAGRKPPAQPRVAASGRPPAPRGQTQAKVLAALRAAPGSTAVAVATAAGIPTNTAAATISRLVKQGRVRRLDEGGYALVETPVGAARLGAAAVAVASDTPGAAAPAANDAETPR